MKAMIFAAALLVPTMAFSAEKPRGFTEKTALAKYDDIAPAYREKCVKAWKMRKVDLAGKTEAIRSHIENNPPYYPAMFQANEVINGVKFTKGRWGHINQFGATQYGVYVVQVVDKDKAVCRFGGTEFIVDGIDTSGLKSMSMNEINGAFVFDGTVDESSRMCVLKPLPGTRESANGESGNKSPNTR